MVSLNLDYRSGRLCDAFERIWAIAQTVPLFRQLLCFRILLNTATPVFFLFRRFTSPSSNVYVDSMYEPLVKPDS
jgi:hypothetical protein